MLPCYPDIDEVKRDILHFLAQPVSDDIQPGEDDNEDRGFGGKPGVGINSRKGLGGKLCFDLRIIDDEKAPGLDVLGRRSQARSF